MSRLQLVVLAALSALASALLISSALGRTPAQTAALAALRERPVEYRIAPAAPAASVAASVAPAASAPAPAAPAPAASAAAAAEAPAPAAVTATADSTTGSTPSSTSTPTPASHPQAGHVFVIALTTPSYAAAFGPNSVARYLNRTLRRKGTLLRGYHSLGGNELPDYLAMISGQGPNPDTAAGCNTYAEFPTGTKATSDGLVPGPGCVYPDTVLTIGDQVTGTGHIWRAYIEGMGASTCVHPNSGAVDDTPPPGATSGYDDRHNPFIYFHSLLDLGGCASNDVSLDELGRDLRSLSRTPRYAFVAPDACLDAAALTCPAGQPTGLAGEDAFLHHWVPRILRSAAYRRDGVLIVAFAASGGSAVAARTGALVLSPHTPRGKTIRGKFDAYSLLRSVEEMFGYKPLGHAASARPFPAQVLP